MKLHKRKIVPAIVRFLILGFFIVITLYPVFWMIAEIGRAHV